MNFWAPVDWVNTLIDKALDWLFSKKENSAAAQENVINQNAGPIVYAKKVFIIYTDASKREPEIPEEFVEELIIDIMTGDIKEP